MRPSCGVLLLLESLSRRCCAAWACGRGGWDGPPPPHTHTHAHMCSSATQLKGLRTVHCPAQLQAPINWGGGGRHAAAAGM